MIGRQLPGNPLPRTSDDDATEQNMRALIQRMVRQNAGELTIVSPSGGDDYGGIQTALDNSLFVAFNEGAYSISQKLKFRSYQILFALGDVTIQGALGTALIESSNTAVTHKGVQLIGIKFDNSNKATAGGVAINFTKVTDAIIDNCRTARVAKAVEIDGDVVITNLVSEDCTLHLNQVGGYMRVVGGRFENTPTSGTGITIQSGALGALLLMPKFVGLSTEVTDLSGRCFHLTEDGTFLLGAGSSTLPALAFLAQRTIGLYRKAANQIALVADEAAGDVPQVLLPSGTSANPVLAFDDEDTLGWYRQAAGKMGLKGHIYLDGDFEQTTGKRFGAMGATPVTRPSVGAAATDEPSVIALGNAMRQAGIDLGLWSG